MTSVALALFLFLNTWICPECAVTNIGWKIVERVDGKYFITEYPVNELVATGGVSSSSRVAALVWSESDSCSTRLSLILGDSWSRDIYGCQASGNWHLFVFDVYPPITTANAPLTVKAFPVSGGDNWAVAHAAVFPYMRRVWVPLIEKRE